MFNDDVISMPDKWEYPWYAAWDLAFHAVALSGVDPDFAKHQLNLMLKPRFLHSNGQLPAYEWNFSDVNPPVHAWATLFQYRMEQAQRGEGDVEFLKRAFGKLLINFTWWVNRKDRLGKSVFEGGFLGLDNIGVFDRSAELPTGGHLEQADGTAWMAMFCQNMFEIAIELAARDASYDDLVYKFAEHFLWIGIAMNKVGDDGMWDEKDGFYYDVLRLPDGTAARLKVRSLVGLLPLCATTVIEPWQRERVPRVGKSIEMRFRHIPELLGGIHPTGPEHMNSAGRTIAALVDLDRLRRILSRMLDEQEFLSPYGIRSVSRWHEQHPYVVRVGEKEYEVSYQPAESNSGMFGGNSNWRGPVWFPMNVLLIRALFQFHAYYGDSFRVECPTGSGRLMTLFEVGTEISDRLQRIFLRDRMDWPASGVRRHGRSSRTTRTGAIAFRSTSTSTATTAPASAPATRPGGPRLSPSSRKSAASLMRAPCSGQGETEPSGCTGRSIVSERLPRSDGHEGADMRVGIATDHGGFGLKEELLTRLRSAGHEIVDFGAHTLNAEDDYPDFVVPLAEAVVAGEVQRGVAICGSGVGASVCANKVAGIRAALVHDHFSATTGRRGRSPQHPLHGRTDGRAGRRLGSRPGVPWRRVQSGGAAFAATGESRALGIGGAELRGT